MSACLAAHELARFATEGGAHAHLDACVTCRGAVKRQTALRDLVKRVMPATTLAADDRRALVGRIVAAGRTIDSLPAIERATPRTHRRAYAIGAMAIAAAAAVAVAVQHRAPVVSTTAALDSRELEVATARSAIASADDVPPLPGDPIVSARGAHVTQAMRGDRVVFALADGMLELDTRHARDGEIVVGAMHVAVRDARVRVRARGGVVTNVQVVVGAAHIDGPGVHVTLEREAIWEPTAPVAAAPDTAAADAFTAGMLAFRAGRDRDAIAQFDRATDPAVAEDAAYWAAQAALRAGDRADAARRFDRFLATYPTSAFAARARRAKDSLGSRD